MKKKSQHSLLGKTATGLIAVLLFANTVFAWNMQNGTVYAEAGTDTVTVQEVKDVAYKVELHTDINEYRQNDNFTAPTYSGEGGSEKWLFAGWYTDQDCTMALSGSVVAPNATGTYYAKYVKKEVLSVKCQLKADTTESSTDTILRCVSSVDSLKYKNIGMELVTPDGSVKRMRSQKVGTKINARDDINLSEFTYSPKAVDVESEYFFSATERIEKDNFGKGYLVKPYWITQDGTCVYGVSKYVTVNQGIRNNDSMVDNHIYIPVQMDAEPAEGATFTAKDGTKDITASCVAYDPDGGYAHLNVSGVPAVSATKYTVKDNGGNVVGTYIYRNMATAYDGTNADTSWYDVYKDEGESKFVIATSADLYGLAVASHKGDGNTFKGQTIYLVSDIEANAANTANADKYVWARIGGVTQSKDMFAGTFDGQMHTIKNIYMLVTTETVNTYKANYYGFFSGADTGAVLKNFKLVDGSYNFGAQGMCGSVVGRMYGATIDTVYSNAKVSGSGYYIGGLIGQKNGTDVVATVNNCWFAGNITNERENDARVVGGLLGVSNSKVVFTDCLNTGAVTAKNAGSSIGGLVGEAVPGDAGRAISIDSCLNTGKINFVSAATGNYGALVGNITNAKDTIAINQTYATTESCSAMVDGGDYSVTTADVKAYAEKNLTGTKAITSIPELFKHRTDDAEQDYRWVVVANSTPVLKSFASEAKGATMGVDTSWYDAGETEYVLKDAADLYGFALLSGETTFEGKTVKLGADITVNQGDATGWSSTTAPDFDWLLISASSTLEERFKGTFDGQGHTISGIYLKTSDTYGGMFRGTQAGAVIKNFKLKNSYFYSTGGNLGSIVGNGVGTFDTIYSDAIVEGTSAYMGGFAGRIATSGVRFYNCQFAGKVASASSSASARTGGIIGTVMASNTMLVNCLNSGMIIGTKGSIGGLVGAPNSNQRVEINYCLNTGDVKIGEEYGYAIVGDGNYTVTCNKTYAVDGEGTIPEKVTGVTTVTRDEMTGTNALTSVKELFVYAPEEGVYHNYWSVSMTGTPVLASFAEGDDFFAVDTSWYDAGKTEYVLKDAADLYGFALLSGETTFEGKTVKLGADIAVNEGNAADWGTAVPAYSWLGIGADANVRFRGTFDGGGHTISGLYMKTTASYQGMFGNTTGNAVVKNFRLVNSYFESSARGIGSIAGRGVGTFDTIYSNAIVVGSNASVGGLLGQDAPDGVRMNNCWFAGSVTNNQTDSSLRQYGTGGLIGNLQNPSVITNCLNTGTITADKYNGTPRVGGLIGALPLTDNIGQVQISHCVNAGKVVGNGWEKGGYGAFTGHIESGHTGLFNYCYAVREYDDNFARGYNNGDRIDKATSKLVSEDEILGDNAKEKMPGLFTDDNTYWTTIENKMPVLISFSEYANGAENTNSLHLWLKNTTSPKVTFTR